MLEKIRISDLLYALIEWLPIILFFIFTGIIVFCPNILSEVVAESKLADTDITIIVAITTILITIIITSLSVLGSTKSRVISILCTDMTMLRKFKFHICFSLLTSFALLCLSLFYKRLPNIYFLLIFLNISGFFSYSFLFVKMFFVNMENVKKEEQEEKDKEKNLLRHLVKVEQLLEKTHETLKEIKNKEKS